MKEKLNKTQKHYRKVMEQRKKEMKRKGIRDPYEQTNFRNVYFTSPKQRQNNNYQNEGCLIWILKYIIANILFKVICVGGVAIITFIIAMTLNSK